MIFIFDNMRSHSDHSIHFYEMDIPEGVTPQEVGQAIVLRYDYEWHDLIVKPTILGIAEKIDWWDGHTIKLQPESFKTVMQHWTHRNVDPDVRRAYRDEYSALCKLVRSAFPGYEP